MKIILLFVLYVEFCRGKLDTTWWKSTNIYELLIHTFKDSNGDGIGDLKGVTSMLDHFSDLNIETILISPFHKTNMIDMGYDIKDYTSVDPRFGTMADFEELIREMTAKGMKMMLDLVINHTSDEHEWFLKSVEKIEPYTDYYVWMDPSNYIKGKPVPPNSWYSWAGPPAWTWNEKRKQYYYHIFMEQQVDLNLKNPKVKEEVKNIIKFWLDKGVAALRLDAPMVYIEDDNLGWDGQQHQKKSFEFIHELRVFLDDYNRKHGGYERIFAAEVHAGGERAMLSAEYYGTKNYPICHASFNFIFQYISKEILAWDMNYIILDWLSYMPEGDPFIWLSENHDAARTGTRIRQEYKDINTIATAMLPGIVQYYYGAEIGLDGGYIREGQLKDTLEEVTRDPHRLVMQWDDTSNSGFSRNLKTYVPSAVDYPRINVKAQKDDKRSHYNLMKNLNILRKTKTLIKGDFFSDVYSSHVYIFWRSLQGYPTYIVFFNLSDEESEIDLTKVFDNLSSFVTVEAASTNAYHKKGDIISSKENYKFTMKPLSSIILSTSKHL